jgi:hypothetical protein
MTTLDDDHPFSRLSEYGGFMRTLVSGEGSSTAYLTI